MANAIIVINKRAKQLQKAHKSWAWKDCIAKASAEYRSKHKVSGVKKKTARKVVKKKVYRQTGSSDRKRDQDRKALPPGVRKSKVTGRKYTEVRKNRSDKPGSLSGTNAIPMRDLTTQVNHLRIYEGALDGLKRMAKGVKDRATKAANKKRIDLQKKLIQVTKKNITGLKALIR